MSKISSVRKGKKLKYVQYIIEVRPAKTEGFQTCGRIIKTYEVELLNSENSICVECQKSFL